jgi:hypothetical protein
VAAKNLGGHSPFDLKNPEKNLGHLEADSHNSLLSHDYEW